MKRQARILVLSLLYGAVLNVVVAWMLALTVNVHLTQGEGAQCIESTGRWQIFRLQRPGATFVWSKRNRDTDPVETATDPGDIVPSWSGFDRPKARFASDPGIRFETRAGDARGWPMRCVFGVLHDHLQWERRSASSGPRGVILLPDEWTAPSVATTVPIALPFYPIWSGFLVNTLLYAFLLWFGVVGWCDLRRAIRLRRGRCPWCAYPMGSSPLCTECGRDLPTRRDVSGDLAAKAVS